jgi:hypothetical protein
MILTRDILGDGTPLTPIAVLRAAEAARILAALGPMLTACDRALLLRYVEDRVPWSGMLRVKTWLRQVEEETELAWAGACA